MMKRNSWRVMQLTTRLLGTPLAFFLTSCSSDDSTSVFSQPGIIGTLVLAGIIMPVACFVVVLRLNDIMSLLYKKRQRKDIDELKEEIINLDDQSIDDLLRQRTAALQFRISGDELSGEKPVEDTRGIVRKVSTAEYIPMVAEKKEPPLLKTTDPQLSRLVIAFVAASAFWLLLGTSVGQYLGMKFIWPEIDKISWLSFGRLRPVHTNAVFWGWASMAMIGLGYFVVARRSNTN